MVHKITSVVRTTMDQLARHTVQQRPIGFALTARVDETYHTTHENNGFLCGLCYLCDLCVEIALKRREDYWLSGQWS
jgi:hypothetical protein